MATALGPGEPRRPTGVHDVARPTAGPLVLGAAALSFATSSWLGLVHAAQGAPPTGAPPLLGALRDGSMLLPVVLLVLCAAARLAAAAAGRLGVGPGGAHALLVGLAAGGVAAVESLLDPLHAWFFQTRTPVAVALPTQVVQDALLAMVAALPVAAVLALLLVVVPRLPDARATVRSVLGRRSPVTPAFLARSTAG